MNADLLEVLFYCAGLAFTAHLAVSFLLKSQLQGDDDLIRLIFLMPNTRLGNTYGPQLLRSKYFMPRVNTPMILTTIHLLFVAPSCLQELQAALLLC